MGCWLARLFLHGAVGSAGASGFERTSPSSRRILKVRLLILSVGELGKQVRQLPMEESMSRNICAMPGCFEGEKRKKKRKRKKNPSPALQPSNWLAATLDLRIDGDCV